MIITVKEVIEEKKPTGEPKQIEWGAVGADGKDIKVKLYPSIKQGDEWLHFEDRWDEFRNAKDKTYDIERANIKVEKGYWKPVIKATEVKDVFVKEAIKQVIDEQSVIKNRSVVLSYSKDLAMEGKIEVHQIAAYAEVFYRYITGSLTVDDTTIIKLMLGGKVETKTSQETQSNKEIPDNEAGREPDETAGENNQHGALDEIRDLYKQLGRFTTAKVKEHLRSVTGKPDIKLLTDEELEKVKVDLLAQIELM